jgi:hypothetical protein
MKAPFFVWVYPVRLRERAVGETVVNAGYTRKKKARFPGPFLSLKDQSRIDALLPA